MAAANSESDFHIGRSSSILATIADLPRYGLLSGRESGHDRLMTTEIGEGEIFQIESQLAVAFVFIVAMTNKACVGQ
jgi:hypothetical protein